MKAWKTKPLGDVVAQMKTGSTPSTSRPEYFEGDIPWFTPGDIGNSRDLIKSSRTITKEALSTGKAKLFDENTLLVTCIGNIGRVGVLQQKSSSNQQITALKFPDEIDPYFAYYWFIVNQHKLDNFANIAVVPILNNERLSDIPFSYPPLPEQKRIAAQLAQADRLRHLRRSASRLGESYLQSAFLAMFGNPTINPKNLELVKFGDVCPSHLGKMLDAKQQTGKNKRRYLRNVNIQWHSIDLSDLQEMDFDEKDRKKYRLKAGDILICEGGEVGRSAIWKDELEECYFQKALHRAIPNPKYILPDYVVWLLFMLAKLGGLDDFTSQVTIAHLTGEKLKELEVPLPPLPEQERFAQIVARYERLRKQMREAERQSEVLFQGLLHEAFGSASHHV